MSDTDTDDFHLKDFREVHEEIERCKKDPVTSGMFVSGWDDADQDVDEVKDPKANPIDYILWAAENGKVATIKEILSSQPGLVHATDADGYTPLHRAAYGNHLEAICCLLSAGASVRHTTKLGWTPLHSACNWNNYQIAARLLAGGAAPAALSDGGQTPLHLASAMSHCKSTLLVLFLREDISSIVNQKNNSNETPEQLARGHGIYAPLFEMVAPSVSHIRSLAFTSNPYVRDKLNL